MIPRPWMQTTKKHAVRSAGRPGPQRVRPQQSRHEIPGLPLRWLPLRAGTSRAPMALFRCTRTLCLCLIAMSFLTGCAPPGPQAFLEGKKRLDRGEYAEAIDEFRTATQLMPTNALAFNYLGLAFHQAGKVPEAE